MKKMTILLMLLLGLSRLEAQTGEGAASSSSAAKNYNWQNWVFASCTLVAAVTVVYVLTLNNGQNAPSN